MTKYSLLFVAVLLSACSAAEFPAQQEPLFPVLSTQAALASATAYLEGQGGAFMAEFEPEAMQEPQNTATPDAMALARALHDTAQKTSDAAAIVVAQEDTRRTSITATAGMEALSYRMTSDARQLAGQTAQAADARTQQARHDVESATQNAVILLRATQTFEAPALALTAVRAENERQYGWLNSTGLFLVSIAILCLAVVMAWLVFSRPAAPPPVDEPEEKRYPPVNHWNQVKPLAPYTSLVARVIPAGVSEPTMIRFAQGVCTSANTTGIPFVRSAWVGAGIMPRPEWEALIFGLSELAYIRPINPEAKNSSWTFTPEGERNLSGFMNDPLPQEGGIASGAGLSSESPPRQAKNAAGEGASQAESEETTYVEMAS